MRLFLAAGLAGLLLATAAPAQECDDSSNMMELDQCAGVVRDQADAKLNTAYAEIRKRLGDDEAAKANLTAAQRAWIAFRDAECFFQTASTVGGSIHSMLVTKCETALTLERLKQFDVYLACEEGDLMCPVPEAE